MEIPHSSLQDLSDIELNFEVARRSEALIQATVERSFAEAAYDEARREQERRDWECFDMADLDEFDER